MLRSKQLWALAVGAILFALPPTAMADATIEISTDGGVTFTSNGGITNTLSATVGTATIVVAAISNSPGSGFGEVEQVQLSFNNAGAAAQGVNLVVRVSDNGFTVPPGGGTLSSSWSGTAGPNNSGSGMFQSAADFSNTLFGGLPGVATVGPAFATSTQSVVIPTIASGTETLPGSTVTKGAAGTPPYALSNQFTLPSLVIGGGSAVQLTGVTDLSAVPAPAGLVLALTGLPFVGLCYVRRRWLKK